MGGYDGNSRLPGFVDVTIHGEVLGKHPLSYRGSDAEIDASGVHHHKRTDGHMILKRSPLVRPCAGGVAELMTLDLTAAATCPNIRLCRMFTFGQHERHLRPTMRSLMVVMISETGTFVLR